MHGTRTPSPDHVEFDELCARMDEWEPLLPVSTDSLESGLEPDPEAGEETCLDGQILAGLVMPV